VLRSIQSKKDGGPTNGHGHHHHNNSTGATFLDGTAAGTTQAMTAMAMQNADLFRMKLVPFAIWGVYYLHPYLFIT
jgi:hypothetical protein